MKYNISEENVKPCVCNLQKYVNKKNTMYLGNLL